jgi:hypothetical protein
MGERESYLLRAQAGARAGDAPYGKQDHSPIWAVGEKEAAQKVHSFTEHHVKRWPQEPYISEDP